MSMSYLPTGPGWNPQPLQQQMEGEQQQEQKPAFDPAAFKTEMLGEMNKSLSGWMKTFKGDFEKLLKPKEAEQQTQAQNQQTEQQGGDLKKEKDPHVAGLELQLKTDRENFRKEMDALKKEREDLKLANEKENRESMVRTKLSKLPIREDAMDDAFALFTQKVTRAEDGTLVADGLPYDQYMEAQLNGRMKYLVKPEDKSGSGASARQRVNGKAVDMETIRPGMTNEELSAVGASIAAAIPNAASS